MDERQRKIIEAVTGNFDLAKVYTNPDFSTTPHYTAVVHTKGDVHNRLMELQEKYRSFDDSLQLVSPELLHVSLGKASIEQGHEKLHSVTSDHLAMQPKVMAAGLVATDNRGALGVAFWSEEDIFTKYYQALAKAQGVPFVPDERSSIGWATLARFTQKPSRELIEYVQDNMFMNLGEMILNNATIYEPTRRDLKNSRIIDKI